MAVIDGNIRLMIRGSQSKSEGVNMTDTRTVLKLSKSKSIKLIKTTDNTFAYDRYNKENNADNQVFTDGMYYFHLNKFSVWKVKEISLDYGDSWEIIEGNKKL